MPPADATYPDGQCPACGICQVKFGSLAAVQIRQARHAHAALRQGGKPMSLFKSALLVAIGWGVDCKLDRKTLPAPNLVRGEEGHIPPRTQTEQTPVDIWAELPKLDRVGIRDDFFALGGHSRRALMPHARIRNTFRVDLPLRALFEASTVEQLAASIHELLSSLAAPGVTAGDEVTEEIEYQDCEHNEH